MSQALSVGAPVEAIGKLMDEDPGRTALDFFLRWAREAIAQDPSHRLDVGKALAETTMSPELRRVAEAELKRLADGQRSSVGRL